MLTGRRKEMQYLHQFYEKDGSQFLVVYGQRGVGKTRLTQEFAQGRPCFYYACREASEREQRFQWGKELSEAGTAMAEFPEWQELFAGSQQDCSGKQILVLDEFQYMMKSSEGFLDELVSFTEGLAGTRELLVIMISSSISWVENSMIKKMGTAANKLSGLLKVKPLGFFELCDIFPDYTAEQTLGLYAVLGGNPGFWRHMSPEKSLKENICQTILSPVGALYGECRRILLDELRELNVYQTILSALASGHNKLNDIYTYTGFSRAKISVYMKNLMELEMIEKVSSYDTEGREHVQKGVYRICNHFVHFTFTYLYPAASRLEMMDAESFYESDIASTFRRYESYAFKEVCREYLMQEVTKEELTFEVSEAGEWAGKSGNIDIILKGENGETLLAACQCEKEEFPYADYEKLLFLAEQAKLRTDHIWLFSDEKFDEKLMAEAREKENLSLILL